MSRKTKINVITLGCSKNLVDSEYLMQQLSGNGFDIIHDSNDTSAKIVAINTCGFIADAKEESINTILSFALAKKQGKIKQLFVFGCLAERYKNELEQELPEVDSFFGVRNLSDIVRATGGAYKEELIGERYLTTPNHYAFLKISEGCNWNCSYCAIPHIRGKHISVPVELLIKEAENLASKGVKELIIIAQDTTFYGLDIYGERKLAYLLDELSKIKGIEWIRLHYTYPTKFPRDVAELMAKNPKICPYIDIPFQHISDKVLSKMKRNIGKQDTYELIDYLRQTIPNLTLRTTLITGHPGEDEEAFEELKEFVRKTRFERLGVFTYSEEENTFAAKNYPDTIPNEVKQARADEIMEIQNEISKELNENRVGQKQMVIIDRLEDNFYIGRTRYDSPEIDQEVLIDASKELQIGNFYDVKITGAEDYDLYAELV